MNELEKQDDKTAEDSIRQSWRELFRTGEGRILLLGIALALTGLIIMAALAFWSPTSSQMMGTMALFNIIFGRAVSMSIGYAGGYGHSLVVPVNMWVETILVLLFYPVFVLSMNRLVVFPRLKRFIDQAHAAAERHYDKVHRYGIIGLFVFVWFPFWMTGPVVGSAIGYLLGFSTWLTLSVVLIGTYIAMAGWAYVMFGINTQAAIFGPWAPALIIGLLIAFVVAGHLLSRRNKDALRNKDSKQHDTTLPSSRNKPTDHE